MKGTSDIKSDMLKEGGSESGAKIPHDLREMVLLDLATLKNCVDTNSYTVLGRACR